MTSPAKKTDSVDEPRKEEDITVERRSRVPASATTPFSARMTHKMVAIDQRILAIARGEMDPDSTRAPAPSTMPPPRAAESEPAPAGSFTDYDPFGGLIPIADDEIQLDELDGDWVLEDVPPSSASPHAIDYAAVLRLRLSPGEILALPIDPRGGFMLSHIDGHRTVEELIDVTHLSATDALDVIGELVALGAVAVV